MVGKAIISLQFIHSVVSDFLWSYGLQHARLPCPSPTPRAYSNSCPWSRWCHPAILSSVIPFSSCPQSLPASGSFHMSVFCIKWSNYWSFSISPSGLISFRMDWLHLLAVQGTLKSLFQHHSSQTSILQCSVFSTDRHSQIKTVFHQNDPVYTIGLAEFF